MPFDIAKLKAEVKPASLKERMQNINDRYTSPSSSSTGYVRPARPAKPTALSSSSSTSIPSSNSSSSRVPALPQRQVYGQTQSRDVHATDHQQQQQQQSHHNQTQHQHIPHSKTIDWVNITQSDKDGLFALLDGYFARDRKSMPSIHAESSKQYKAPNSITQPQASAGSGNDEPPPSPPPPAHWARPSVQSPQRSAMSYPALPRTSCHAEDVAQGFSSLGLWKTPWFTADRPLPPALEGRSDMTWTSSWSSYGTAKTLVGTALFSDLSIAWWKVEWDDATRNRPNFMSTVQKEARLLRCPAPFSAEELWHACSTYGEQVAAFAEGAEQRGVPVGRGECWDIASQALSSVTGLPAPVPSLARTHGHLIYSGTASGRTYKTMQSGTWRGHDTAVRRGDIVEWRKVRVRKLDGTSWSDLGDPDHTAVIVGTYMADDAAANTQPTDGAALSPWEVGTLEVIEQSQGKAPSRAEYNLAGMESGEIWIYRPVGMQNYLGIEKLSPEWEQSVTRGNVQVVR